MQFVNFTGIMSSDLSPTLKEAAFALAALMEIPTQYTAVTDLGLLGYVFTSKFNVEFRPLSFFMLHGIGPPSYK